MKDIKDLVVGSKVFSITHGFGVIVRISKGLFCLEVYYTDIGDLTYTIDGKAFKEDIIPELYVSKPSWYPKTTVRTYKVVYKNGCKVCLSENYYKSIEEFDKRFPTLKAVHLVMDSVDYKER